MTTEKKFGCGGDAVRIIYRGKTKRLFACEGCAPEYKGSGRVHNYATDVKGVEPPKGFHTGPARACGFAVEE